MSSPGIARGFTNEGTYKVDNLIAGDFPRISQIVTITGHTSLVPGTVLGRIREDSRYQLSETFKEDGSEIPDAILAEFANLTDGDVQARVYFAGEFNEHALTLGADHSLDSIREAFRTRSIFLRSNQA